MCSARAFWGVGMMGRSIYFFFHLSRRYHELFSPTTLRTALPRRSGIQEKRKRNYNIIIMELRNATFLILRPTGNKFDNSVICFPFLRQFGALDVFFPGAPACTWNCMAPVSSFSLSIWRHWRFLPWTPCLHLNLHGDPLVLFSVNLALLTFSSLEPLLALETAWCPSRPFLRQFDTPDVFFPGAPACTWNCMAPLSSFFSVNWRPWPFTSLEPLLSLETAWRPSRPFLRQFGAPDVFFPGAPACTWNCMAPLSSFSPSICAPDVFYPFSSVCTWNCMAPLSSYWFTFRSFFFLSCSLFLPFFLFPSFPLFSSFLLSLSFPFLFSFFLAPLFWPRGAWAPKAPPKIRPC